MAIVKVQSVTGNGATLVLNGVVAGNALFLIDSYYRSTSTGVGEAVPTDTNGTFLAASADAPSISVGQDAGVGIFHEANAAAGAHTVTPQANTTHNTTLVEFSGLLTAGLPDVATSAKSSGAATSQATGTTGSTAQASELSLIAFAMAAGTGSANVGLIDPVTNYITLQINQNDASSIATEHSYQILSSVGTQSATFNWTVSDAAQWWHAAIATFKAAVADIGPALNIPIRAGRGPRMGPTMRRMFPQTFPTPALVDTVTQAPQVQPVRSKGPGMGPRLRKSFPQRYPDSVAVNPDVTRPLTGVSETSAVGTLGVQHTNAIAGVSTTTAVGSVKAALTKALTGVSTSASVGALGTTRTKALAGISTATTPGTMLSSRTVPITGAHATGSVGTVTATTGTVIALTGVSASLSVGSLIAIAQSSIATGGGASGAQRYRQPAWWGDEKKRKLLKKIEAVQLQIEKKREQIDLAPDLFRIQRLIEQIQELQKRLMALLEQVDELNKLAGEEEVLLIYTIYRSLH